MSKIKLIDWDILNRVYYCLLNRLDNYRVITTNVNDRLNKITIIDENDDRLFSIDKDLKIESYDSKISVEMIKSCFAENGIHAL